MKELIEILKTCRNFPDQSFCLATVVQVEGSSYRKPGARMLIFPNGKTVGSISGGCLEQDVILRAQSVFNTRKSIVVTYDTGAEEDIFLGTGLGCKGVIQILIEPLGQPEPANLISFVECLFLKHQRGAVATVIQAAGATGIKAGDRVMLNADGSYRDNVEDAVARNKMISSLKEILEANRPENLCYEIGEASLRIFAETIQPPASLVVFGAGYDAIPLVGLAAAVGYQVTVVDGRPAYAVPERFPQADAVIAANPENFTETLDEGASAIIMTHNYLTDQGWLKTLLPLGLPYLGLMGPRKRAEKMLEELRNEGWEPTAKQLRGLHNPVGLDLGAENPEQIALAILGEIQAVSTGHRGGSLRDRKGPIHAAREPETNPVSRVRTAEIACLTLA